MSRQCPKCFAIMTDDDAFCGRCGHTFAKGMAASAPPASSAQPPTIRGIVRKPKHAEQRHPGKGPGQPVVTAVSTRPGATTRTFQAGATTRAFQPGAWIWLLPVLGAWLGGLCAWSLVRERDQQTATNLMILGFMMTGVIWLILYVVSNT